VSNLKLTTLIADLLFTETSCGENHSHRDNHSLLSNAAQYLITPADEHLPEDKILVHILATL
jgi:hypothetical protein